MVTGYMLSLSHIPLYMLHIVPIRLWVDRSKCMQSATYVSLQCRWLADSHLQAYVMLNWAPIAYLCGTASFGARVHIAYICTYAVHTYVRAFIRMYTDTCVSILLYECIFIWGIFAIYISPIKGVTCAYFLCSVKDNFSGIVLAWPCAWCNVLTVLRVHVPGLLPQSVSELTMERDYLQNAHEVRAHTKVYVPIYSTYCTYLCVYKSWQ